MRSRTKLLIFVPLAVLVLAIAGGLWWFFKDDAPEKVSLSAAVESIETTTSDGSTSSDDTSTTTAGDISGTWVVDTETGDFDYEEATGTYVGFRIQEELAEIGSATAVGRTGDVSGSISIDGTTLTAAEFEVDLTTITTNESRRDDRVQGALETDTFPTATFALSEPVEMGEGAADGQPVTVNAVGNLTIHGVTRSVTMPIEAQLVNGTVAAVGAIDIVFADYGVAVPTSPAVLSADDNGILEFQMLLVEE